ncbi:MAG TPA: LCP family protein [Candidatus Saccharimonadales bacterium]
MDNFRIGPREYSRYVARRQTVDGFVTRGRQATGIAPASLAARQYPEAAARIRVSAGAAPQPVSVQQHVPPRQQVLSSQQVLSPQPIARQQRPSLQLSAQQPAASRPTDESGTLLARLDLGLDDTPAAPRPKNRLTAGRAWRKWALRGGLAMFLVLFAAGALLFAQGYLKLHKVFKGGASHAAALQTDVNPDLLKGEGDGRVNVLLLGNGGGNHDGPDLTDSIIVASIDPVNKEVTLLSVPRDLWVKMPNNFVAQYQKINAAYESGKYEYLGHDDASNADTGAVMAGFKAVDQTINQVLGITIDYNAVVNFTAFQQAVNTVDGITVDVPSELYDPTMAWQNNWNPILAEPGVQQMNGKQALLYVRSRETTSDFARSARQRAVILALKQKVLTLGTLSNPLKISSLMSAFGDNMVTDISLSDAVRMYDLLKGINDDNIKSIDLVTPPNDLITTGTINGISMDMPKAGMYDYSAIQEYVRSQLKDGYITKENAKITVLDSTDTPGLAAAKANELKSYGYNVTDVGATPTEGDYNRTVIVDLTNGQDKYTRHYLENRFGVSAVTQLPQGVSVSPGSADFVIILGEDQT